MAVIDNLAAYWPFDEASGSAIDVHGANTMTETSGTIATASGTVSGARDFEYGESAYFTIADNDALSIGDINFSLAGWVNLESTSFQMAIIAKWNYTIPSNEYLFQLQADGSFMFSVTSDGSDSTAVHVTDPTTARATGTWYFVAFGHNATANDIWISVDAGTPTTTSHSAGAWVGTSSLIIGALQGDILYFDGLLDEWGLWKRDIRADLSWLKNGTSGRSYADIVAEAGGPPLTLVGRSVLDYGAD